MIYKKDLTEDLRLRLSRKDMDFLRDLSLERSISVSECIRSIIGEYRRSLDTLSALHEAIKLSKLKEGKELSYSDTETHFNDQL